jgi:hypothetical protein
VLIAVGFSLFSKNLFDFSLMGIWWVHVVLLVCVCLCVDVNVYRRMGM